MEREVRSHGWRGGSWGGVGIITDYRFSHLTAAPQLHAVTKIGATATKASEERHRHGTGETGTLCCGPNKHPNQPAPEVNPPKLPPPHTPCLYSSKTHRVCKRRAQRHKTHIRSSFSYGICLKQWTQTHTKDSKGE